MMHVSFAISTIKKPYILSGLSLLLVAALLLSLSVGQLYIAPIDLFRVFGNSLGLMSGTEVNEVHQAVLLNVRLPRVLMTVLVGGALAVSGAALQGLFRNPLVEPGLIGVSSGSAFGVVMLIVFGTKFLPDAGTHLLMPMMAFGGGLLATWLVTRLGAQLGRTNVAVLVLAGVAINALAGALMGLAIFYADENQLRMFTFWTLGDLGGATWPTLIIAAPLLVVSATCLLAFAGPLNAIAVGEAEAFHMGVNVEKVKLSIVFLSAMAVGVSVSLTGIIGFVGLVVPHLVRVLFHPDHKLVLPASLLSGPLLLLMADLIARTVVAPSELPIGVVTALVGAPFFIFLIMTGKRRNEL